MEHMKKIVIKKMVGLTLTAAVMAVCGGCLALTGNEMDTQPGQAYTTIDGKLSKVEGDTYVVQSSVQDYRGTKVNTKEVRIHVSKDTKKINGDKKVGERIRAEITRGGFANSIQ